MDAILHTAHRVRRSLLLLIPVSYLRKRGMLAGSDDQHGLTEVERSRAHRLQLAYAQCERMVIEPNRRFSKSRGYDFGWVPLDYSGANFLN